MAMLVEQDAHPWSVEDAAELYEIERWGKVVRSTGATFE